MLKYIIIEIIFLYCDVSVDDNPHYFWDFDLYISLLLSEEKATPEHTVQCDISHIELNQVQ